MFVFGGWGGYKQLDIVSSINKDRIVQGNNCAKALIQDKITKELAIQSSLNYQMSEHQCYLLTSDFYPEHWKLKKK